jgi:hypothetical protein
MFIEVYGFGRSGHHAMLQWMIKNITGGSQYDNNNNYKLTALPEHSLMYINEGNFRTNATHKYLREPGSRYDKIIISYEDSLSTHTELTENKISKSDNTIELDHLKRFGNSHKFFFIRDFFNNIASRHKRNKFNGNERFMVKEKFIELWKSHAYSILEDNQKYLKYEDWLHNNQKRNDFINNLLGHDEVYDNKGILGTKSSFNDSNYLNRFKESDFTKEHLEMIYSDRDLEYVIKEMGYEYRKR